MLSTRLGDTWGAEGWVAMLRSCAAYEAYLRDYRRGVVGSRAVEFLFLDRLFPRSVFHALRAAESVLFDLDLVPGRPGAEPRARRAGSSPVAATTATSLRSRACSTVRPT